MQNSLFRNIVADNCDRSAFSLQKGIDTVSIEDSVGLGASDQALDMEPGANAPIANISILRSVLARTVANAAGFTVTVGGTGTYRATNVLFEDTLIAGAGLQIIDAEDVTFSRVTINSGTVSSKATVEIQKRAENILFEYTTITRPISAPAEDLFWITNNSAIFPTDVTIQDSRIIQNTPTRVFHLNNLPHFTLLRSHVTRTASVASDTQAAIYGSANQADMTDVSVSDCDFALAESPTLVTLASSSGYHAAQAVVEDSRAALITAAGVRYKINLSTGGLGPASNPVITNNTFLAPTTTCDGWSGGGCP